jgi:hypothetical protein
MYTKYLESAVCNVRITLLVAFLSQMSRVFSLVITFVASVTVFAFLSLGDVYAQDAVAGIGLSPAITEGNATPGETQTHKIGVTNLSKVRQTYYIYKKDIVGVQDGGVPIFAEEGLEKTGYELTEWINTNVSEITLNPGEEQSIEATIAVPENATPCSHFGGVIVSMQPPRMRETGAAVGYEVAHIISLRVAGECVENAQIRSFSTGDYIYSKSKIDFKARIENKGSTLIRPIGPLEIYNMFGKRVAMLTFNESKAGIFPFVTRDFDITWENENPGFGRYEALLSVVYGDEGRQATISSTASFWILPLNIILPALGVLAVVLLIAYVSVKIYINRTIQNVSGSTRRIVRRRKSSGMSALLLVVVVMLAVTALFLLILLALFA